MSHLSSARVDLAQFREATRRNLLLCLDKCIGSKAIIWDDKLTGSVSLIAEYSLLKEHEVGKMFTLAKGKLPNCEEHHLVYFVRPKLETMKIIAENIKEERAKGSLKEFHIFFVPNKSTLCENKLKDLNIYGDFSTIDKFDISLIPFENDVLSLEQDKAFYECYVENDFTTLHQVANSLMTLQALYGVIPHILGKGEMSAKVTEIMLRKRKEMVDNESHIIPLIDTLLLIDRSIDLITPLLSQLVYEGLIDEIFKIENTNCQLPSDCISSNKDNRQQQSDTSKAKVALNSSDNLFAELRSMNFSAVALVLSREAKRLAAEQEEHRTAKTVGEMKQFVHKLPHIQAAKKSLYLHTGIAEKIKEKTDSDDFREALGTEQEFFNGIDTDKAHPYIEKCIATKEPLIKVLRLICLQCCTNNGFKIKLLEYYKRELFHTYGLELLSTFLNLEKVGLLRQTAIRNYPNYPTLKKNLKLVVEGVHEQNPNDIAYVHSGFAPISIRLAQFLERFSSWKGMEEILKLLPGPDTEVVQDIPVSLKKAGTHPGTNNSNSENLPKITLVYFIGGCTYSEISALRFLAQQENAVTSYVIATTKIINGNELIDSLIENFAKTPISA